MTSPLTPGELVRFFTGIWLIMGVLIGNCEDDLDAMLGSFEASSSFDTGFGALLVRYVPRAVAGA